MRAHPTTATSYEYVSIQELAEVIDGSPERRARAKAILDIIEAFYSEHPGNRTSYLFK